jgi:hypothetical protein
MRGDPARKTATIVLDTGALIAAEGGADRWRSLMRRLLRRNVLLAVPSGALSQAWRGTARQARLAQLLADRRIVHMPLDQVVAKAAGVLLGRAGVDDAVDASVVICARREHAAMVITSDPDDLRRLDPQLPIEAV